MKKVPGLLFALLVIAMAFALSSSAFAIPDPPPNDNVCICHQTQYNNKNQNANQKGVLICVDPHSLPTNKHFKHGDDCVEPFNQAPACEGNSITLEECTGEIPCDLDTTDFAARPECCTELGIDPNGSELQCVGTSGVNLSCASECVIN